MILCYDNYSLFLQNNPYSLPLSLPFPSPLSPFPLGTQRKQCKNAVNDCRRKIERIRGGGRRRNGKKINGNERKGTSRGVEVGGGVEGEEEEVEFVREENAIDVKGGEGEGVLLEGREGEKKGEKGSCSSFGLILVGLEKKWLYL